MSAIIQVCDLTKQYGAARGVSDVTFVVEEGEIFGFLGPNGAGKTTTIRTLMGLLKPTAGIASIAGLNCWAQSTEVKRVVGYLPGEFSVDPSLTGAQIITYLGNLRGGIDQEYVRRLVERLDLDLSRRFREYSRGNKQKVGLVQAFMHRPRVLILDEPTSGLDPLNQQEFYQLVSEVRSEGHTVLLSSHILPEVEHTCDRVGIIREGKLVKVDAVEGLKDLRHHELTLTFPGEASPTWFASLPGVLTVRVASIGSELNLTAQGDLREILKVAVEHGATNIVTRQPSLEEIFLRFYAGQPSAVAGATA